MADSNGNWWERLGPRVTALAVEFQQKYGDGWPDEYYRHDREGVRMGDAALGDMEEKHGPKFPDLMSRDERLACVRASCASVEMNEDWCDYVAGHPS